MARRLAVSAVVMVGVLALFAGRACPAEELWSVSFRPVALAPNERIVGFEFRIRFGTIASLPTVPIGWSLEIENGASSRVSGSISVGAAAFTDWRFFREFVLVQKVSLPDVPAFELEGLVFVTVDFQNTREIALGKQNIILKKAQRPTDRAGGKR